MKITDVHTTPNLVGFGFDHPGRCPMSAPILFLDTETTGLDADDEVWEIAAVLRITEAYLATVERTGEAGDEGRYPGEWELHLQVHHDVRKVMRLPTSFRVDWATRFDQAQAVAPARAAKMLAQFIEGSPVIVGANPSFDIRHLERLLSHLDLDAWPDGVQYHYRPVDVGALAYGYLSGQAALASVLTPAAGETRVISEDVEQMLAKGLPWSSDELSLAVGIDPADYARHTAMGDVRWVMAIYDRITGGAR